MMFLFCAKSKVSDRRHLSELHIPGFGCSQQRLRNSTHAMVTRVWLFMLGKDSAPSGRASGSVLAKTFILKSCVFRICIRINNFYVYALYSNLGHDGSLYDCLLDSMARVRSVDDKAVVVFVSDSNAHHSEWLELISPTDRHGRDALDFCDLSDCEQLVRSPTHIAGNRLNLAMTDVPDRVDVVVSTPLGTSDHCFVSCALRVEQSVPEYNIRSSIFLKHRTNWNCVCSAVRSFTWSTILKSADPLASFDRAIGEVIGRHVPTTVLQSRSGDK